MNTDPRIDWLIENVPAFKPAYEQAEAARKSTEENRKRMAALIAKQPAKAETEENKAWAKQVVERHLASDTFVAMSAEDHNKLHDGRPSLNQLRLQDRGAA